MTIVLKKESNNLKTSLQEGWARDPLENRAVIYTHMQKQTNSGRGVDLA